MKVGSKGRYAVVAIVDVAMHGRTSAVSLADVAQRQDISLSYLEQLFAMLRRNGLVVSSRGPGGGYRLAKPAEQTTIREIFEAVDENAARTGTEGDGASSGPGTGIADPLWKALLAQISAFLEGITVADVIERRIGADGMAPKLSPAAE